MKKMKSKDAMEVRNSCFAKIWSKSRADAGKTQGFMAEGLGVSRKTVQNWERGVTAPDLFAGSEWFRVLGLNPLPYYLSYLYPDIFDGITSEDDDEVVEKALISLVHESTGVEKRQLLFLMTGEHGSSWYSLLQMLTAHCHTGMQSRVNVARMIVDNYEMDKDKGEDVCPENVLPDVDMLKRSIEEGKASAIKKANGYTSALSRSVPEKESV